MKKTTNENFMCEKELFHKKRAIDKNILTGKRPIQRKGKHIQKNAKETHLA